MDGLEMAPDKLENTIRESKHTYRTSTNAGIGQFTERHIAGMIRVIDQAKKDTTSGRFINWCDPSIPPNYCILRAIQSVAATS